MQRLISALGLGALSVALGADAMAGDTRVVVNPPQLADSTVYGYSQANVVTAGATTVYVSGQVGIVVDGDNSFEKQVDRAFASLLAVLEAAGAQASDVAKITLLIVDHNAEKLAYLVKKRRAVFGAAPPASTLIPVTRLYTDGVTFEIDAIAVLPPPSQ